MIKGKHITDEFCDEAINIDVYLKNRSPTKILEHETPFETLYVYKLVLSHLRIFGSKAFLHVLKEDRRKLVVKEFK